MAETTVKQRAFAFISCSISEIGLSRFVYVGAIFSAVAMCRGFHLTVIAWQRSWHCCISCLHLRLFPRPFSSHAMEWSGIVGEETSVCCFKSVPTWVITNRLAHAQQTWLSSWRLAYPILSYPVLTVSWLFSMFSGEFWLRLKPYLVVRIASDVLTKHYCQVCIMAMMFCRSDCRLCAGMCGKWLRNQGNSSYQCTTCFGLLTLWHSNMGYQKYSLHLIFTLYLNRNTLVLELFPVVVFQ